MSSGEAGRSAQDSDELQAFLATQRMLFQTSSTMIDNNPSERSRFADMGSVDSGRGAINADMRRRGDQLPLHNNGDKRSSDGYVNASSTKKESPQSGEDSLLEGLVNYNSGNSNDDAIDGEKCSRKRKRRSTLSLLTEMFSSSPTPQDDREGTGVSYNGPMNAGYTGHHHGLQQRQSHNPTAFDPYASINSSTTNTNPAAAELHHEDQRRNSLGLGFDSQQYESQRRHSFGLGFDLQLHEPQRKNSLGLAFDPQQYVSQRRHSFGLSLDALLEPEPLSDQPMVKYDNDSLLKKPATAIACTINSRQQELTGLLKQHQQNNQLRQQQGQKSNESITMRLQLLSLVRAMDATQRSHNLLQDYDRRQGLRKCHCRTMRLSSQSRSKVREFVKIEIGSMNAQFMCAQGA